MKCASLLTLLPVLVNPVSALPPAPETYWNIGREINITDEVNAGLDPLKAKHVQVYNGVKEGRTYAHHTVIHNRNGTVYLAHSSHNRDEDSMGQNGWLAVSQDGGHTWSKATPVLPSALLPNQTDPAIVGNNSYWVERSIWQRAISPHAFLDIDDQIWVFGKSMVFIAYDGKKDTRYDSGDIARQIGADGQPTGDPCWVNHTPYTFEAKWDETIYGTEYGMRICDSAWRMLEKMRQPPGVTMYSDWLFDNYWLNPGNASLVVEEPSHAVWIKDSSVCTGGYWQRFWRDASGLYSVWVEWTSDPLGRDWYPQKLDRLNNKIFKTNIPDRGTKEYYAALSNGDRYMVHNPRVDPTCPKTCLRQPLVLSMSRGKDQTFRWAGVLRTNASAEKAPGLDKNPGFSYPSAVEVGDTLVVGYSENKENVWVTIIDSKDLPQ